MAQGQELLLQCEEQGIRAQIRALLESHRAQPSASFHQTAGSSTQF